MQLPRRLSLWGPVVLWAAVIFALSAVPSPDESDGIDENAKITAAQTTTGPQSVNFRI